MKFSRMKKTKKSKIDEYIKEYEPLKELYKDFSHTIKCISENLLRKNEFKYQAITCREKSETSLRNKLNTIKKIKSVKDIDDLAGCRIIFYLDKDIQRFIQYLWDEFEDVKQNLKYSDDSYNALHLVVKLRKELSKYEKFNGLQCEIQLTTVLYHSWAELAHDVIYKPAKSLSEFDKPSFESIKARFARVMKEFIKPAQHDFDFIARKWEGIKQGEQIFSEESLHNIERSEPGYETWQNLKLLREYVEKFGDKTPKELNIIEIINNKLEREKVLEKKTIRTALGDFLERGYEDIAEVCLDIFELLRNVHPKDIFETLVRLSTEESEKIRKKSLDVASRMAEYTFYPEERKIYYSLQLFILGELEKWSSKKLITHLSFIVRVSENLLSPSALGISRSDHESVTIHQGPLPAGDTVKEIRERTINILQKLYSLAETIFDKRQVLQAFEEATTYKPYRESMPSELKKVILENINAINAYYSSIVKEAENGIIKIIEEQSYRLTQRFPKGLKNLNKLSSLIEKNTDYGIYKVLVGWNYCVSDDLDWDVPDELDWWNKAEKKRKQKIDGYVEQIDENNFVQWRKKILSIIKTTIKNYEQLDSLDHFNDFLNKLGRKKPEIAQRLISENEKELEHFLIHLVAGIWQSKQKENARQILEGWIKKSKHLSTCASIFKYVEEIDEPLLNKIYKKAKEQNDVNTLTNIIGSIASNFERSEIGKGLFVDCIKELTKHKTYRWAGHVQLGDNSILKALDKNDWDIVLKNLLYAPSIDLNFKNPPHEPNIGIHLNKVLSACAKNSPKELIRFFYERVKIHVKKELKKAYEAIPVELPKLLKEPLSQHAKVVIEEIPKWFKKEDELYYREGGHLLQVIFPAFHPELEEQLIKLLRSKNKDKADIVLWVLRSYEDETTFLHNVCKEFIKQYPKNREYRQELFCVLSKVGTVKGEYGFVEGCKRRKQEIQEWKKDESGVIRDFAQKYEIYLSKWIDYEKKSADENIEMRKRKFED